MRAPFCELGAALKRRVSGSAGADERQGGAKARIAGLVRIHITHTWYVCSTAPRIHMRWHLSTQGRSGSHSRDTLVTRSRSAHPRGRTNPVPQRSWRRPRGRTNPFPHWPRPQYASHARGRTNPFPSQHRSGEQASLPASHCAIELDRAFLYAYTYIVHTCMRDKYKKQTQIF